MITVSLIGYGTVGRALSLLLLGSRYRMQLNIVDPDPDKRGVFLDLKHGQRMHPRKQLHFNNQRMIGQSDYIFFTAGKPTKHGASRLTTADENIGLVNEIFGKEQLKPSVRIIAISNPVDLITKAILHVTGLPASQVVGTGTLLDSARFSHHLAEALREDVNDVNGWVLGEHGESQVAAVSMSLVKGTKMTLHPNYTDEIGKKALLATRNAAYEIRKTEAGTSMAVSQCALLLFRFFEAGKSPIIPLSAELNPAYLEWLDVKGPLCLSVPAYITENGVQLAEIPTLTEEEMRQMKASAAALSVYAPYFE